MTVRLQLTNHPWVVDVMLCNISRELHRIIIGFWLCMQRGREAERQSSCTAVRSSLVLTVTLLGQAQYKGVNLARK